MRFLDADLDIMDVLDDDVESLGCGRHREFLELRAKISCCLRASADEGSRGSGVVRRLRRRVDRWVGGLMFG